MTDLEVFKKCINELYAIPVPCSLTVQIAVPICNVALRLNAIAEAAEKKIKEDNKPVTEEITTSAMDNTDTD